MARVFVGIPTFNRPHLVRETIESLRGQTFQDWEALVSDNLSAPDAAAQVENFVASLGDARIRFHRQDVNEGKYGQGRLFLEQSRAHEFLAILHDDDLIAPDYLARAVAALDAAPDVDVFAASFGMIGLDGRRLETETADRLRLLGRSAAQPGRYDILTTHVMSGFTPISGTVFRRRVFEASGFADPDRVGNYPFECDLFLRLGDVRAQGWFDPAEGVSLREHAASLKSALSMQDNPLVVEPMLSMFGRRRYQGRLERRRRVLVSHFARADGLIRLRRGDVPGARRQMRRALAENPLSPNAWIMAMAVILMPDRLRRRLPPLQTMRDVTERNGPHDATKVAGGPEAESSRA